MNRGIAIKVTFLLLRSVAGLLFMQAGGQKILAWFGGIPAQFGGQPPVGSQTWFAGMIELIAGAMILVGFLTRPAAFLSSGLMAFAYFIGHFKMEAFWPQQNQGIPAVLFCFVFLFVSAMGGGPWSLDGLIWGKNQHRLHDQSHSTPL